MSGDVMVVGAPDPDACTHLLTAGEAEDLTARIVALVDAIANRLTLLHNDLVAAYRGGAAFALGYGRGQDGWDAYCAARLGALRALRLPRDARAELVEDLRVASLSTRAIASAVGVSAGTVRNDLADRDVAPPVTVRGVDGRTHPGTHPAQPEPEPAPVEAGPVPTATARVLAALALAGRRGLTSVEVAAALPGVAAPWAILSEAHRRGRVARLAAGDAEGTRGGFAVYVDPDGVAGRAVEGPGRRSRRRT